MNKRRRRKTKNRKKRRRRRVRALPVADLGDHDVIRCSKILEELLSDLYILASHFKLLLETFI